MASLTDFHSGKAINLGTSIKVRLRQAYKTDRQRNSKKKTVRSRKRGRPHDIFVFEIYKCEIFYNSYMGRTMRKCFFEQM